MVKVLKIEASGNISELEVGDSLEAWQALIDGGYLEAIRGDGWVAFLDEDGKAKGLPWNPVAGSLASMLGWVSHPDGYLVGPVVFTGPTKNGKSTAVDPEVVDLARVAQAAYGR